MLLSSHSHPFHVTVCQSGCVSASQPQEQSAKFALRSLHFSGSRPDSPSVSACLSPTDQCFALQQARCASRGIRLLRQVLAPKMQRTVPNTQLSSYLADTLAAGFHQAHGFYLELFRKRSLSFGMMPSLGRLSSKFISSGKVSQCHADQLFRREHKESPSTCWHLCATRAAWLLVLDRGAYQRCFSLPVQRPGLWLP